MNSLQRPADRSARSHPDTHACDRCAARLFNMCCGLDSDELGRLAAIATTMHVPAGETFIEEATPATHAFNITAGTAKAFRLLADGRCQITGFVMVGDFIGLSRAGTFAYSVTALTPLAVCRFERTRLARLLDDCPKIERRLLDMATNELMAAQDQMVLLGRQTARERVASFLLNLSQRDVEQGRAGSPLTLAMTRGDIGDYLGLTIETVSRTFTVLKNEGIIALKGHHRVDILLPVLLAEAAGREAGT